MANLGADHLKGVWVFIEKGKILGYQTKWTAGEPNGSGSCGQMWSASKHSMDDDVCVVVKKVICEALRKYVRKVWEFIIRTCTIAYYSISNCRNSYQFAFSSPNISVHFLWQ